MNWDGTYLDTGQRLPEGVYFYAATVYTRRLEGIVPERFSGELHLVVGSNPTDRTNFGGMFTGIIEAQGQLVGLRHEGTNVHLDVRAPFTSELQIDQSVAHDGVCLTVVGIEGDVYTVTAIEETLAKTHLGSLPRRPRVQPRALRRGGRPHRRPRGARPRRHHGHLGGSVEDARRQLDFDG